MIGMFCVIRTKTAGVHCGTLQQFSGTAVRLTDARRIWRWSGANSLHEVSQNGAGEESRISEPVPLIALTEAIEVLPCSEKAKANLTRSRWKG